MINPFAYYDCLSLAKNLQKYLGSFTISEIQLFAYLSCLLSLFNKNPQSAWGYNFAGTKYCSPFSAEIEKSTEQLIRSGSFSEKEQYLLISESGISEHNKFKNLSQNLRRDRFLEGASSSLLAMPIEGLQRSILNEPGLSISNKLSSSRLLLDNQNTSTQILYEQFNELSSIIGVEIKDLMIPSVLWLTFLSKNMALPKGDISDVRNGH